MDEFLRHQEILTPEDLSGLDVDIVGSGALGGSIAVCLAKMGFGIHNRLTVTDFDRCETVNLATQWFRSTHVTLRQPKVEALAEMIAWVCEREIATVNDRFSGVEERSLGPVVIVAVDSLAERAAIWERLKSREDVSYLIDARMGAEVLELYIVDLQNDSTESYEASLKGEPLKQPCTRQAIFYTVLGGAAFVGSILRAIAMGEAFPRHLVFDFRNFFLETDQSSKATIAGASSPVSTSSVKTSPVREEAGILK